METFVVNGNIEIAMPESCINNTVQDIIEGFLYRSVQISFVPSNGLYIKIGNPVPVALTEGESVISVSKKGIYIAAVDERALLTSFFILLRKVIADNLTVGSERFLIPIGTEKVCPKIQKRMLHLCVFPRTAVSSFKKLMRLACVLGYTHIILEFWGTFPYTCLSELAWKDESFSKEEIKEILQVAKDLKVETIPMINSFGHATGSSAFKGKHVVLDQNPRLATLFSHDGWWWRFDKLEVRNLLKKMRKELYEVFGAGKYFHVGFDEAFSYPTDEQSIQSLCGYIHELCTEILTEGRTPMMWGDHFLHEETLGVCKAVGYEGNAHTQEIAKKMLSCVPQETIICDWQYRVKEGLWKTTKYFTECGRDKIMVCPWADKSGFNTAIETAEAFQCYGVLHTTWNNVFSEANVHSLFYAHDVFYNRNSATKRVGNLLENATLLRKICPADGNYEKSGWFKHDANSIFSL